MPDVVSHEKAMVRREVKQMEQARWRSVKDWRNVLGNSGLRCTQARLAVLQVLEKATQPITHAEVVEQLAGTHLDAVSLYRNLVKLASAKIITRIDLGDHLWRYELNQPGTSRRHPHFLCVDCGAVTCLSESSLLTTPSQREHLTAVAGMVVDIIVRGRCRSCL